MAVYLPKGKIVFSQGDEGESFYVIYMGAAKVHVVYSKASPAASLGMATNLNA